MKLKKLLAFLLAACLLLPLSARAEAAALPDEAPDAGEEEDELFATVGFGGAVERYLAEKGLNGGQILIGWQDVESGVEWYRGADVLMDGSNTYRLPLCMLYADYVAEGRLSREDKVGPYVLERAVEAVLTSASPNPAEVLRRGVSSDHREYRAAIAQNCGMELETIPDAYFSANQFFPRFLIGTLRTLWDNSEKYDWVTDYLKRAQPDNGFGLYRGEYELAHIIGREGIIYCDTGVVYAERPFLLTVMTSGVPNAEREIGEIARLAMDYAEYLSEHPGVTPIAPEPAPEPESAPETVPAQTGGKTEEMTYHFDADFAQESLGEVFERYLNEKKLNSATIAIGWYELESGEEWYYNGDRFLEGASTYKLPLAMIYADKIAAGELTEESRVAHYVLRDALEVLIVNSSNAAGYVLRRELTRDLTEYRSLLAQYSGLDASELPDRYYRNNLFSPRFLIGTLHTLYDEPEKYALILDLMKQARPDTYFGLYSGEIEVAHKYGSDVGYVCDSGIIYTERPFLLCVMTYNIGYAQIVIGQLARIAMDYAEYLAAQEPAPTTVPEPTSIPAPAATSAPTPTPAAPADGEAKAEAPQPTGDESAAGQRVLLLPIAGAGLVLAGTLALLLRRQKK